MMYQKPTVYDTFKHVLKCAGIKQPIKKTHTGYETACSYRDVTQKVFFDSTRKLVLFKSLHQGKETIDRKLEANWKGDGKVEFKELRI